ncbi:hypothetical protein E2C01_075039 [Portunus trituberculatus]|uniref:Uncharacterized protein n=1 Tax=Portunus trituberculatus TaxID=210409 RepID=A0A5B7IF41_PORTR|nr:hypothetical protein [Portunus trituberculatus]
MIQLTDGRGNPTPPCSARLHPVSSPLAPRTTPPLHPPTTAQRHSHVLTRASTASLCSSSKHHPIE